MFSTIAYKTGFIHFSISRNGVETIEVQMPNYLIKKVKSYKAAQIAITKYEKDKKRS